MSIIQVDNLTFAYPSSYDNIFENVSFRIDSDWKLGFIGRNGRGKTTFLNLLQGKYEYQGSITASVKFYYFPYPVADKTRLTTEILQEICPEAEEWRFLRELNLLDVKEECLYRPFDTLSEGERTKALLAALFLNEGHFLLIDEPTNHLDTEARDILSAYLKRKKSFILVSHDRAFIDGCVDHVLSLNRANIEVQCGNFSSFMTNFQRQEELERKENKQLQGDIKRLKQAAKRTEGWANEVEKSKIGAYDKGYIGHKSEKMMKRAKVVEARVQGAIEEKSKLLKNVEVNCDLKVSPVDYRSEKLAAFLSVAPIYDGVSVCSPVTFEIMRGDRIALEGRNGSGKSSLVKLLCGEAIAHTGRLEKGSNLVISYVPQDTSHLNGLLSEYARESKIDEPLFKAILHKMGFTNRQFEKDMKDFSEGQKKKTVIARSLCEKAHLYVWDEPLNYIDVYSRMQIEDLLVAFKPTMIFVEHDRAFQNAVATKKIVLS